MNQITVSIFNKAGVFAENKDAARDIRVQEIMPALERNEQVVLDFEKVDATTQSFIHALISEVLRVYGSDVLDKLIFKSCNKNIKEIIKIVIEYMQEGPLS